MKKTLSPPLQPLPFQHGLVTYLQTVEPALWQRFSAPSALTGIAEATRLELLKNTVRLSPESAPSVYKAAAAAAAALQLEVPIVIYQGSNEQQANAMLYFVPEVAHIVLFGAILKDLNDAELRALFGHELAHHRLWTMDSGRYWVADRLLDANIHHGNPEPSHYLTAARYRLYTELYADRGSALAAGRNEPAISCLLKIKTGLTTPDVAAYRQQVAEVLAAGPCTAKGDSHPEEFIRVRALDAWRDQKESLIPPLIQGPLQLDRLDCLDQQTVERLTHTLLKLHLQHQFLHTEATLGQARLLWPALPLQAITPDEIGTYTTELIAAGPGLHDYWCYLLLDMATADPELEEIGFLASQLTAEQLAIRARFIILSATTVKITQRRLKNIWKDREKLMATLATQPTSAQEKIR